MGYPNFGKVKTIVLPILYTSPLTYSEYKEKFGIDLKDIFEIGDDRIKLKIAPNSSILFDVSDVLKEAGLRDLPSLIPVPTITDIKYYESGVEDAETTYYVYGVDSGDLSSLTPRLGIRLNISNGVSLSIENMTITGFDA